MTVKVQLVLQGGGAKIYAIMAFLEALQEVAADGKQNRIEVNSIVGTSAGAIAGTLFAAKVDLCALRAAFKNDGAGYSLVREFPEGKSRFWKMFRLCKLILLRAPFWSQRPLEIFLKNQLDARRIKTFSDIKALSNIDVHVLATDLTRREAHVFKETDDVVESLLHSAAIPFFFRSWHSKVDGKSQLLVDGGIAENFPASALKLPPDNAAVGLPGRDDMVVNPSRASSGIDKVQFLLEIPATMYNKVTLANKPGNQPGTAMTQQECNSLGMVKYNFKRMGWVGKDIAGRWGVDVRLG